MVLFLQFNRVSFYNGASFNRVTGEASFYNGAHLNRLWITQYPPGGEIAPARKQDQGDGQQAEGCPGHRRPQSSPLGMVPSLEALAMASPSKAIFFSGINSMITRSGVSRCSIAASGVGAG